MKGVLQMFDVVTKEDVFSLPESLMDEFIIDPKEEFCFAIDTINGKTYFTEDKLFVIDDQKLDHMLHVYVYGAEINTYPHIHVYMGKAPKSRKEAENTGMCLSLTENVIFNHGGHKEVVNEDEFVALAKKLETKEAECPEPMKSGKHRIVTWWKAAIVKWNMMNRYHQVPYNTIMPIYDFEFVYFHKSAEYNHAKKIINGGLLNGRDGYPPRLGEKS